MPAIDPTGPFAALGILLLVVTGFMSGKLLSRNTVPREDYVALLAVNANYAVTFGQQTEVIKDLAAQVAALRTRARR